MKNAIRLVYEYYPKLEIKMKNDNIQLAETEDIFYRLVLFFLSPDYGFDLRLLYNQLTGEDLMVALNAINVFFKEDTFLLKEFETYMLLKENDLLNQKMVSDFLVENGFPTLTQRALNVYYSRNQLPEPDLIIGNKPYWSKTKIENYAKQLKEEKPHLYKADDSEE